jgi:hypothetical protein
MTNLTALRSRIGNENDDDEEEKTIENKNKQNKDEEEKQKTRTCFSNDKQSSKSNRTAIARLESISGRRERNEKNEHNRSLFSSQAELKEEEEVE